MLATREALARAQGRTMLDAAHDLLNRALDRVDRQLRSTRLPHVLAHGDFTRFNIRREGERFNVFDWEYARRGANPIADMVHFFLSQPGRWSPLTVMHHTLAVAEHALVGAYDGWGPSPRDVAALALHGLVDTMTFYSNAGTPLDFESFLVRRYFGLIAAADQWGLE
jgi:aminoglycoside phosphotransferase (APT) family kinase protein